MRVARLFGIDIYIDLSWLFIFVFVAWALSSNLGPFHATALPTVARIALGAFTALLFFASVLAHELAHSLVARMRGLEVSRITLFIFGGVSQIAGDFESATGEGWVAFVGPLMSVVIAVVFFFISAALGVQTPLGIAAGYLSYANAVLAVFNLLPAYPLDGGKVLHSLIWRATGDRRRATRVAAGIGQTIALIMIAFGIVLTFTTSFFSGLWFALIGWFLYQAGGAEALQTELALSLRGRTAQEIATLPPPPVSPDATARAATEMLLRSGQRAAPVAADGRLAGIITLTDLARAHATSSDEPVASLMTPIDKVVSVPPSADSMEALATLAKSGFHQLPVIDANGSLVGFITREGLLRRLTLMSSDQRSSTARTMESLSR
jgi:Zn-dependent protease/CBS domain-containing protein